MRKKTFFVFSLFASIILPSLAKIEETPNLRDTTKVVDIEEVVVIGSPKTNTKLRQQPTAVSIFSQNNMLAEHITSLKNLTTLTPNFFMPDYGSHLTSAIYIRGIGSRINTPAIGLYVDNIPYLDKSAFDFNFYDIERIDVLRGPQGTLFGRNTMGGLIQAYTKNPFRYQGTDLTMSAASENNNYRIALSHYHKVNQQFAFSVGGFYEGARGFFKNRTLDKWADPSQSGGGRIRAICMPHSNLKFDFSTSYEYNDEGGYTYGKVDTKTGIVGDVLSNEKNKYRRGLFNTGLNIEYQADNFIFNSISGYQNLRDRMFMDQDFSAFDTYTLQQKQKLDSWTQEFTFKSKPDKNWQWVTGTTAYYQHLNTNSNVGFGNTFISMLQTTMDAAMAHSPVKVTLTDNSFNSPGLFKTPLFGAAIYHQSTFNNFLGLKKIATTIGLRANYEWMKIDYDTQAAMNYSMTMMGQTSSGTYAARYFGKENHDYIQLLPKLAVTYQFNKANNLFTQVSRGMRSGGYNIQIISEYLSSSMQKNAGDMENNADVNKALEYKPEYSWNYEIGSHLTFLDSKLWADISAFYIETRDQQVSRFVESGLGRYTANAGKSHSYGAEASLLAQITHSLSTNVSYGYTRAIFKDYESSTAKTIIDYTGNYVPFVPRNTVSVGAAYVFFLKDKSIQSITVNANYHGMGKTFWTEANNASQCYYGTYNGRISAKSKYAQLDFWIENVFNKKYNTFYFESMGSSFAQINKSRRFGIDIRLNF